MTCTKDCKKCIYGVPQIRYACHDKNTTCNGECLKCSQRQTLSVKYICTYR